MKSVCKDYLCSYQKWWFVCAHGVCQKTEWKHEYFRDQPAPEHNPVPLIPAGKQCWLINCDVIAFFLEVEKYCKRSILLFLSFAEGNGLLSQHCQKKTIWDFRCFSLRGYCLTNTVIPTQGTVLLCLSSCSQGWCKSCIH